jgi:hypothetical protein
MTIVAKKQTRLGIYTVWITLTFQLRSSCHITNVNPWIEPLRSSGTPGSIVAKKRAVYRQVHKELFPHART